MLDRLVSMVPGEHVVAQRTFRLEQDLFLGDHALGRQISVRDPALRGLPIVPLTVSMEMLAEAGSLLCPDLVLTEMEEIRTYRWIALEAEPVSVQVEARRIGEREVAAQISLLAGAGPTSDQNTLVEGRLHFAEARPAAPSAGRKTPDGGRRSRWQPDDLYRTGMFHGPTFQGVTRVNRVMDGAVEADIRVLPPDGLFRDQPAPNMILDPVLLDQPGQVVALWTAECLDTGYVIFPYRLGRLRLFATAPSPGEEAVCRAQIELLGQERVRSRLDVVGRDGAVWFQMDEWEDRRFHIPDQFLQFIHNPVQVRLGHTVPQARLPKDGYGVRVSLTQFPAQFFTAQGGIWQKVLAYLILGQAERKRWHRTEESERPAWLLGRLAAKEAVCGLVAQRIGMTVAPADVEIQDDAGRLSVNGDWLSDLPGRVALSIEPGDDAVAVAQFFTF